MSLISIIEQQLDEASGPVFWINQQIYDAANASQIITWANLKDWQKASVPITLSSGQVYSALPITTIMIPQFIVYNGVKLFITNHAQLQDWADNWKNESPGTPNWAILWDASHLQWFPPSNGTQTLTLWGVPWATEISSTNTDITGIDPLVVNAIAYRAVSMLMEETQPQLADAKELEALEFEARYARNMRRMLGDNILRLRPTTAWDQAQFGDIRTGNLFFGNQN